MSAERLTRERLNGNWTLVEVIAVDAEGRPCAGPYGPKPMGSLTFNADGRMMGTIVDGRPTTPAGETRGYTSYCGNFEFADDQLTTHVDAASDPDRLGGAQVRRLELREGHLVLKPPRRANGELHEFVYRWVSPA